MQSELLQRTLIHYGAQRRRRACGPAHRACEALLRVGQGAKQAPRLSAGRSRARSPPLPTCPLLQALAACLSAEPSALKPERSLRRREAPKFSYPACGGPGCLVRS